MHYRFKYILAIRKQKHLPVYKKVEIGVVSFMEFFGTYPNFRLDISLNVSWTLHALEI